MTKKLLIFCAGTSILQLVTYILLLQLGISFSNYYWHPHSTVSFGISINFSVIVFFLLSLAGNVLTTLVNKKNVYYSVLIVTIVLLIYNHYHLYLQWPNRAVFIMAISGLSVLSKIFYDKVLGNLVTRFSKEQI